MELEKDRMLNETEAALFMGVARQTIATWRYKQLGPAYFKLSKRVVYKVEDLEDFIQSCRVAPRGVANGARAKTA